MTSPLPSWPRPHIQHDGGDAHLFYKVHGAFAAAPAIFDYVDCQVPMLLRMFEKRLRGYRAIGYARGEAPLGFSESTYEPFVEYDDDASANPEGMFS